MVDIFGTTGALTIDFASVTTSMRLSIILLVVGRGTDALVLDMLTTDFSSGLTILGASLTAFMGEAEAWTMLPEALDSSMIFFSTSIIC